jgi:cation diffusion facilitator family transporter
MQTESRDAIRVTLVGAVLDLVLGVLKIAVGLTAGSQGLVADGVHSLSDLVTDGVVLYAARAGSRAADTDHPYGHGKIQTMATVFLGASLIAVAIGIGWNAVSRLISETGFVVPSSIALVVALLSILSKEWIYHYTMRVARRLKSPMLKANAWHSRSDALSSVVVLIGIAGSMAGLIYLDAVAAVVVAAMIVHVGWSLGRDSIRELIDTGLDRVHLDGMRNALVGIEGVRDVHQLRTRRMGSQVIADVHVIVNGDISVSEGHRLSEEAERVLDEQLDEPTDITVHIDVEDDEDLPPAPLPLRAELVPGIRRRWEELVGIPASAIQLHYLKHRVGVELHFIHPTDTRGTDLASRVVQFRDSFNDDPVVGEVRILQELP